MCGMQEGRASKTAELVCMGRAVAHGAPWAEEFADPTAFELLPPEARERALRVRAGDVPKDVRARMRYEHLNRLSRMMAVRTTVIDDAIRAASHPQLVVLGAGLDGRAWRMPELENVRVFEVDHPDTQRDKKQRVAALHPKSRDVRFVPVDFRRDNLAEALAKAGHDASAPTTWIWEGVVMYLTPAEVEATLAVVSKRSAPKSRLVVVYHSPALILWLVGALVRRLGEPLRSTFTPKALRALFEKHGFSVTRDADLPTLSDGHSADVRRHVKPMGHTRIATAERAG
jgi:methyltransferase (TIGR00027 family)